MKFSLKLKGKTMPRGPIVVHIKHHAPAEPGYSAPIDDAPKMSKRARVVIARKKMTPND